jgi:putative flippase GtrA
MFAKIKSLLADPVHSTLLQVPRALAASGLAFLLDFGLLVIFVERLQFTPAAAAVISYLAGGVVQYVLCARWVFSAAPESVTFGVVAFILLSLVGLGITWLTMVVLCDLNHVNYMAAKITSIVFSFAWNFLSRKYLLFRPRQYVAQ